MNRLSALRDEHHRRPDTCTRCGGDLQTLPDGRPNSDQKNNFIDAMQIGNLVGKAVFAAILLIFLPLAVRFLF